MDHLLQILKIIGLILIVLLSFNVIIFVHELGHFLAAKWRGLYVDRFYVWFGKPLWKKTIKGVEYGLGSIPAGGFVSLPQMAPMESVEGSIAGKKNLPAVSPLDKIIVAFAGPLFSFLLALVCAVLLWGVGKPADMIPSSVIGAIGQDSPAEKAGFQLGDEILTINGEAVDGFVGKLNSVVQLIALSEGERIDFEVKRDGSTHLLTSEFEIPETPFWKRKEIRKVGFGPTGNTVVAEIMENSPADLIGLAEQDQILSLNGAKVYSSTQLIQLIQAQKTEEFTLEVKRGDETFLKTLQARLPEIRGEDRPMIGAVFTLADHFNTDLVHPSPWVSLKESGLMMWKTITKVASPKSDIGVQHLSGPVGIGNAMYQLLNTEDGWRRLLSLLVLFNVNLGILNLLPFPVLDGGHITLALGESIRKRPMNPKFLEKIQTFFALILISFMLYVTSKDIPDLFSSIFQKKQPAQEVEIRFLPPQES